jgi:type I restriction enzyme S subunit
VNPETSKTLKAGWRRVKFGDVERQSKEKADPETSGLERYVAGDHMDTDDHRLRRWGEIGSGYLGPAFHMRFKPGQILYGSRRTYLRKVAIADFEGICANTTFVLEPKNHEELLPEFLPFLMQTSLFNDFSVKNSKGSVNPYINFSDLARFEFELPSADEQARSIRMLYALEQNRIALDQALESAIALEWSQLEGALDSAPDEYLHPVENLVVSAPRNGLSPKVNADERGYPTLSISCVRGGRIITEGNIKYSEVTPQQALAYALKPNDVLVVRGNGNKFLTGKCGLVDTVPHGCFYPDLLIRLQFDEKIIRPQFAALQWNSPSVHKRLVSRAKSTNGIWKINGGDIRKHALKSPPLEEQDALLEVIRHIRQTRANIEARRQKTLALKSMALQEIALGSGSGI